MSAGCGVEAAVNEGTGLVAPVRENGITPEREISGEARETETNASDECRNIHDDRPQLDGRSTYIIQLTRKISRDGIPAA